MSKLSDYFDYYSTLLPVFLISTGIVLITAITFNRDFLFYGVFLFVIGILTWASIFNLKTILYKRGRLETYNNLIKAEDIFVNYISTNKIRESSYAIEKFTKYFLRAMDSIDLHLDKGIKIDYLKNEGKISVRQILIQYLPIYLKYGNKAEIDSFQMNLNLMKKLVDNENNIISLDITKVIYSIYQDIIMFLKRHNYALPKNIQYLNLRQNIKSSLENTIILLMTIFILIGLVIDNILTENIYSVFLKLIGVVAIAVSLLDTSFKCYRSLKDFSKDFE